MRDFPSDRMTHFNPHLQTQIVPFLPKMAATFPRSGCPEWVSVAEQAIHLLASVRSSGGGASQVTSAIEDSFENILKSVILLEGVAAEDGN